MDAFASLWDEASRDIEDENTQRRLAHAKVACASFWSFLASAQSPPEYGHRKALAAERIEAVATSVGLPVEKIEALLDGQFDLLHQARTAASYVEDKKTGKDVGGPYADDDDAENAIKSDQFGEDESDLTVGDGGGDGDDDDSGSDADDSDDSDSSSDSDDDDDDSDDGDSDDDSDSDSDSDDSDGGSDSGNPFAGGDGDSDEDSSKESSRKVALPAGPDNNAASPGTITQWGQDVQMNNGAPPLVPSPVNSYDESVVPTTPLTADTDVKSASRIKTALVEGEDPLLPVIEVIDSAPGQPEKPVEHDEEADFSNSYSELPSDPTPRSSYAASLLRGDVGPKAGSRKSASRECGADIPDEFITDHVLARHRHSIDQHGALVANIIGSHPDAAREFHDGLTTGAIPGHTITHGEWTEHPYDGATYRAGGKCSCGYSLRGHTRGDDSDEHLLSAVMEKYRCRNCAGSGRNPDFHGTRNTPDQPQECPTCSGSGGVTPKTARRKTAAPQPAPAPGTAGAAPQPNPMAGGMPAMVMPMGQPQPSKPTYPEGGGTSPNANAPGNTSGPSESRAAPPLTGLPDNSQSTKPRQMPSGGGGGMGADPFGSPSGQAAQDAAGSPSSDQGGANLMSGDSGISSAYSKKVAEIVADIRRHNPRLPESRALRLAMRVAKMPGVVAIADDEADDSPQRLHPAKPEQPQQQQQGGGGLPMMPKVPGLGGGAAAGEVAGGAGAAAGLTELLPLLAL